jgi:hypothetical protein
VRAADPPLFTRIDFKSKFFLAINRFLPQGWKDEILVRTMDIKAP